MRFIIVFLVVVFNNYTCRSQTVTKGNILFSTYYGIPLTQLYITGISSTGPIGGRIEYCNKEKSSIGLEYSYKNQVINSINKPMFGNPENQWGNFTYTRMVHSITIHKNYFLYNENSLNVTFTAGVGYNFISKSYTLEDEDDSDPFVGRGLFVHIVQPIAVKLRITSNYYFTKNFGASLSVGLGQGGLVNGGLVYKLNN
jgi:hypothetical protein